MEGEKVDKRPTTDSEQAELASLDRGDKPVCVHGDKPGEDLSEMAVRAARLRGEGKESSAAPFGSESRAECWLCLCSLQGLGLEGSLSLSSASALPESGLQALCRAVFAHCSAVRLADPCVVQLG